MVKKNIKNFSLHCKYGTFSNAFDDDEHWIYTLKMCKQENIFMQFNYLHNQFVEIHGLFNKLNFKGIVYHPKLNKEFQVLEFLDMMSLQLSVMEKEIRDHHAQDFPSDFFENLD